MISILAVLLMAPALMAADSFLPKNAPSLHPLEAYDLLIRQPGNTFLIDVRTREEYTIAHPAKGYNIPWRFNGIEVTLPQNNQPARYQLAAEPNPDFLGVVQSLFKTEDQLLIICDNGQQSAQASDALLSAGFKQVRQVQGGVWGERLTYKDNPRLLEKYSANYGRGGLVNGWVYWGLPMSYTLDPLYMYPPDIKRAQNP